MNTNTFVQTRYKHKIIKLFVCMAFFFFKERFPISREHKRDKNTRQETLLIISYFFFFLSLNDYFYFCCLYLKIFILVVCISCISFWFFIIIIFYSFFYIQEIITHISTLFFFILFSFSDFSFYIIISFHCRGILTFSQVLFFISFLEEKPHLNLDNFSIEQKKN